MAIDGNAYPAASWLFTNALDYTSDLHQDLNGDGVSLLMGYASNLDPSDHLAGSLPVMDLTSGEASMAFYAASPGITYKVETSSDLETWSED